MTPTALDQLEAELATLTDDKVLQALRNAPPGLTATIIAGECERRGIDLRTGTRKSIDAEDPDCS